MIAPAGIRRFHSEDHDTEFVAAPANALSMCNIFRLRASACRSTTSGELTAQVNATAQVLSLSYYLLDQIVSY